LFDIILENMDSEDVAKLSIQPNQVKGIEAIEEAKENDEQTSYQNKSHLTKSQIQETSKITSHNPSASYSRINHTSNTNVASQFRPAEGEEEILTSFNKDNSRFSRDSYAEEMVHGEDINCSPDSSIRIPRTSFTHSDAISERQNRFEKDRQSSIHAKADQNMLHAQRGPTELEQVKEELRDSESKHYEYQHESEVYRGSSGYDSMYQPQDTEIIVAEVDSADLDKYGKKAILTFRYGLRPKRNLS